LLYYVLHVACDAISCYTCSSLDDNYCPDAFTDDDYSGIVPLNDCGDLHEAQHCVKTTGVTGGTTKLQTMRDYRVNSYTRHIKHHWAA